MTPLSRLPAEERIALRRLTAGDPLLGLYVALAEADAAGGADASLVLLGRARRGAALGARFDGLTVFSTIGVLEDADLACLAAWPGMVELHLPEAHRAPLLALAGERRSGLRRMVAMAARTAGAAPDPAVEALGPAGWDEAVALMAAHNPETVLSDRMARLPFAAIRQDGRLLALAGTIGMAGDAALIGHFLTVPQARGRGLARRLAAHLRWRFGGMGVARLVLATTEDNVAACRAYAAAGFSAFDRRWQLELAAEVR
jgi:GNAT superfamily N-acetyltransferase